MGFLQYIYDHLDGDKSVYKEKAFLGGNNDSRDGKLSMIISNCVQDLILDGSDILKNPYTNRFYPYDFSDSISKDASYIIAPTNLKNQIINRHIWKIKEFSDALYKFIIRLIQSHPSVKQIFVVFGSGDLETHIDPKEIELTKQSKQYSISNIILNIATRISYNWDKHNQKSGVRLVFNVGNSLNVYQKEPSNSNQIKRLSHIQMINSFVPYKSAYAVATILRMYYKQIVSRQSEFDKKHILPELIPIEIITSDDNVIIHIRKVIQEFKESHPLLFDTEWIGKTYVTGISLISKEIDPKERCFIIDMSGLERISTRCKFENSDMMFLVSLLCDDSTNPRVPYYPLNRESVERSKRERNVFIRALAWGLIWESSIMNIKSEEFKTHQNEIILSIYSIAYDGNYSSLMPILKNCYFDSIINYLIEILDEGYVPFCIEDDMITQRNTTAKNKSVPTPPNLIPVEKEKENFTEDKINAIKPDVTKPVIKPEPVYVEDDIVSVTSIPKVPTPIPSPLPSIVSNQQTALKLESNEPPVSPVNMILASISRIPKDQMEKICQNRLLTVSEETTLKTKASLIVKQWWNARQSQYKLFENTYQPLNFESLFQYYNPNISTTVDDVEELSLNDNPKINKPDLGKVQEIIKYAYGMHDTQRKKRTEIIASILRILNKDRDKTGISDISSLKNLKGLPNPVIDIVDQQMQKIYARNNGCFGYSNSGYLTILDLLCGTNPLLNEKTRGYSILIRLKTELKVLHDEIINMDIDQAYAIEKITVPESILDWFFECRDRIFTDIQDRDIKNNLELYYY